MGQVECNTIGDEMLLVCLKQGDTVAFKSLYYKYWTQTFNSVYKRLKNHDQAEDITQDIFLQLWQKRETVVISNLPGYLYVSGRNLVYKFISEQEKLTSMSSLVLELECLSQKSDAKILTKEFMESYDNLVKQLPEGQQTIFNLRFQEDINPDKIALQLNISEKTVRNQIGKALATLRAILLSLPIALILFYFIESR